MVAVLVAVMWVDRALADTLQNPTVLCLTQKDKDWIVAGTYPSNRQDTLVAKAVNFHRGVPTMIWWRLRGATIQLTYGTFWSRTERTAVFRKLTSKMRDCPPHD
jgi:hypothetical protein